MDEDYVLRRLVGSYNPSDAIHLPFDEQRGIIQEITGYRVSSGEVARRYLADPRLSVLVEDPAVAEQMRQELADHGYVLLEDRDLRDYFDGDNDATVLAREETNWEVLEAEFGREDYLELLIDAGTLPAFLQVRSEWFVPIKHAVRASLRSRRFDLLSYLDEEYDLPVDDQLWLRSLSHQEVETLVRWNLQTDNDSAVFLPVIYYQDRNLESFRYFFSLLPTSQWKEYFLERLRMAVGGELDPVMLIQE